MQIGSATSPEIWDRVVRLSHWTIAFAVIVNGLLDDSGGLAHIWIGWAALLALAVRLAWGVVGSPEARFSAFPPNPAAAVTHLRGLVRGRVGSHRSHNPAGAMMIYTLWASLVVVILTGLAITGWATPMQVAAQNAAVASGDWSALAAAAQPGGLSREARQVLKEVHEVAANLMLFLALIHVGGVAVESWLSRRNLVAAMVRGRARLRRT